MAIRLPTARTTFLKAVREFPRWMSIRKRPDKAISGLHLRSIIDEQTDIMEELDKFIKEFFLITYVGKESNIAAYVYIIQVGNIDVSDTEVIHPSLALTTDAKYWLQHMGTYALYQGGYIIISTGNLPEDQKLLYTYNGYTYGGTLERYHIWNIFDEFAMFLGLERYTDVQETNAQLLRRCFLVFQNPTNSTREGLQNVILNAVSNDLSLEKEDVKIEIPDDTNMWLPIDGYENVYEYFAQLNKDIFRTKRWNIDQWEHTFKQLEYLPHQWDKELEVYQDGTGQMNDLLVSLAQDEADTTNVTVLGFKKDQVKINEYFHKQDIRKKIDISLMKYTDILKPQKIQYQIKAVPAIKIDPNTIYINEQTKISGIHNFYLQDIVTNTNGIDIVNNGLLEANTQYELVFKPREAYTDMAIRKINLVTSQGTTNLKAPNKVMILGDDGVLRYKESIKHITQTSQLKSYTNIVNAPDGGMTIQGNSLTGQMIIDVTGCNNKTLKVKAEGTMLDVTHQYSLWSLDGLKINSEQVLYSDSQIAREESATLELDCMGITFELEQSTNQGSCLIKIWEDGELNVSQLYSTPNSPITREYDYLTHVKVQFVKSGEYPFKIKNIKAAKYEVSYSITAGKILKGKNVMQLSNIPTGKTTSLTITLKGYDTVLPTIKYIHVGSSAARASYKVTPINSTSATDYLEIDTDCIVELYELNGIARTLVSSDYSTRWAYQNNSVDEVRYLEIDIGAFSQVTASSKTISKTSRSGNIVSYITLNPGEKLDTLTVTGTMYRPRARRTIKDLMGWEDRYNVYIAKGAEGFIVRDTTNSEEWFARIDRNQLSDADVFTYEGLPSGSIGFFNINRANEVVTIANTTDRNFEDTFISTQTADTYIAYNEVTMYKSIVGETENITITNTFSPILDMNQMMFYTISEITNTTDSSILTQAVFKKVRYAIQGYYDLPYSARKRIKELMQKIDDGELKTSQNDKKLAKELSELKTIYNIDLKDTIALYERLKEITEQGYWSLGQKELYFTTNYNFNNEQSYGVSVKAFSSDFSISSTIDLERTWTIDNETVDLAEYVVVPPSDMEVVYDATLGDEIENGLVVSEDGFNKLKYSNIESIQTLYVNSVVYNNYTLLKEEGIIVWNDVEELLTRIGANNELTGEFFYVAYEYKVPIGIKYKDIASMYNMISYTADAYLPVEVTSTIPTELEDGDNFLVTFEEDVDLVPQPECSNPNFIASYKNGTVTVQRLYTDNAIIVKAGYYYDDDKEYYYYNSDYYDTLDLFKNVKLHEVKKLDLTFYFMIATVNYLLNTDFQPGADYVKLCYVPFNDKRVETTGISKLNSITACDTYNMWYSFNMVVSFVEGVNGLGILFSPDDDNSYAVLNLTKYIKPKTLISLFATKGLDIQIYRERKINSMRFTDGILIEPYDTFTLTNEFYGWVAPEDIDMNYNYYLLVRGNGILDDIIAKDDADIDTDNFSLHVKNCDSLSFDVQERDTTGTQISLMFDPENCNLDNLEIDKGNTIKVGSNVSYSLTKVWEMSDDYDNCTASETVTRRKGMFITTDQSGTVKTPLIYVQNSTSIHTLYIKINNIFEGNMKNFSVRGYATHHEDQPVADIGLVRKTNVASFMSSQVDAYLQFEIIAERNRIIDSIEVYAQYAEGNYKPLRVQDYDYGSVTTKIYDLGSENDYKLKKIEGTVTDLPHCAFYIRGYKRTDKTAVWTDWYSVSVDQDLNVSTYTHEFNNYQFFQFRIDISRSTARVNIKNFIMEVV